MKGKHSQEYYKDILRVNRLLQSSLLEMRYHCEVYKLSLQCINKILHSNTTDLRAFSASHIIDDDSILKYSAKSNYQRNVALISQRRALNKISVVLKKAKTYIKGYSLLEKAESLPLVLVESSSITHPVEVNSNSKIEDDQLNRYFVALHEFSCAFLIFYREFLGEQRSELFSLAKLQLFTEVFCS